MYIVGVPIILGCGAGVGTTTGVPVLVGWGFLGFVFGMLLIKLPKSEMNSLTVYPNSNLSMPTFSFDP